MWAREAKEARVEPRRARDTSEGNAAPAADRNRQETKHIYKLGHIEILWSTRATEMRPSPPHRRELASRNENTVTRASTTAPGTSRGASPHRLQTRLAAKRHSCRRRCTRRGTPCPRARTRLELPRFSLLRHRHLQLGQPGLRRGALRSGDGTAGQSAVGVGRAERRTRVERTRSDDLPLVGASVGSGRGGGAGGRDPRGSEGAPGRRVSCGCSRSPP